VTAKKWEITHVIILFLSDCHEVHQAGGMRYEGDYYIKIKPEKTTKPFKVLCKVVNGTGNCEVMHVYVIPHWVILKTIKLIFAASLLSTQH
jgi:hypothetical protein